MRNQRNTHSSTSFTSEAITQPKIYIFWPVFFLLRRYYLDLIVFVNNLRFWNFPGLVLLTQAVSSFLLKIRTLFTMYLACNDKKWSHFLPNWDRMPILHKNISNSVLYRPWKWWFQKNGFSPYWSDLKRSPFFLGHPVFCHITCKNAEWKLAYVMWNTLFL